MVDKLKLERRDFLRAAAIGGVGAAVARLKPAWAQTVSHGSAGKGFTALSGNNIDLAVARTAFNVNGRTGHAISINGTIPAPLIRLREGERVVQLPTSRMPAEHEPALP